MVALRNPRAVNDLVIEIILSSAAVPSRPLVDVLLVVGHLAADHIAGGAGDQPTVDRIGTDAPRGARSGAVGEKHEKSAQAGNVA